MPDPGFPRPCAAPLRAVASRADLAAAARRQPSVGRYEVTATSAIDRVIRISAAVAVLTVTGLAAYVSYLHAYAVIRAHGASGVTARLEPATIDGLVYASSMVILYPARNTLTGVSNNHPGRGTAEIKLDDDVNDAAVAAYRLSVQAGSPLSER
jgi:Protein of unknown function (DUF2637)